MLSSRYINPISEHMAYHYRNPAGSGPLLSVTHRREMTSLSRRKKRYKGVKARISGQRLKDIPLWLCIFHLSSYKTSSHNTCTGDTKHQEDGQIEVCVLSDSQWKGKSRHIDQQVTTSTYAMLLYTHRQISLCESRWGMRKNYTFFLWNPRYLTS